MKTLVAMVGTALTAASTPEAAPILHPLKPVDNRSIRCGCAFSPALDSMRSSYAAHDIIVLNPNGVPPHALVNLGAGNVQLEPEDSIAFPLYQCVAGQTWKSRWRSPDVQVALNLSVSKPGDEACWFEGSMAASIDNRSELFLIKGACGC